MFPVGIIAMQNDSLHQQGRAGQRALEDWPEAWAAPLRAPSKQTPAGRSVETGLCAVPTLGWQHPGVGDVAGDGGRQGDMQVRAGSTRGRCPRMDSGGHVVSGRLLASSDGREPGGEWLMQRCMRHSAMFQEAACIAFATVLRGGETSFASMLKKRKRLCTNCCGK